MTTGAKENPRIELIRKIGPDYVPPRLPRFLLQHISSPATDAGESMRLTDSILVRADQYKPKTIANVMHHAILRMQRQAESWDGALWAEDPNSLLVEFSNWEGNFSNIKALTEYRRDHPIEVAQVQSHLLKRLVRSPDINYETLCDFGIPLAKDLVLKTGEFSHAVKLQRGLVARANKGNIFNDLHDAERFKQQTRELADRATQVGHNFAAAENDPGLRDKWHRKATLAASRIYMANGQFDLARTTSDECQAVDSRERTKVQAKILAELIRVVPSDLLPFYFDRVQTLAVDDDSLKLYFALALLGREDSIVSASSSMKDAKALLSEMSVLKDERVISQINLIYGSVGYYIEALRGQNKKGARLDAKFLTQILKGGGNLSDANKKLDTDVNLLEEAFLLMMPHKGVVDVIMQGTHDEFKKRCIARVVNIITMNGRIQIETDEMEASPDNIYLNETLGRVEVQNLWGGPKKCFNDKVYVALLSLANRNSKVQKSGIIYKRDPLMTAAKRVRHIKPLFRSVQKGE